MTGQLVDLNAIPTVVAVGGYRAEFLSWGYFEARPWRNYLHSHSFFEICYAYAGHGTFYNRGETYDVRKGDVFVARPGEVHEIVADGADPLGIYFWAHTLRLEQGAVADDVLASLTHPTGPMISARVGSIPALLDLLDREAVGRAPGIPETVAALARALIIATARAVLDSAIPFPGAILLPGVDAVVGSRGAAAARTMIRYLHDNYERELCVRDVAAQVHMSERHAARLFRRATGSPVRGYLQRLRMEVAATRLAERELSVKEIARSCGYPDVRHFTTAFRQRWSLTPAAFRQQHGTRFVDDLDQDGGTRA
jgi:AraC family L-rhamnose operon transcriptional activator RhaR